MFLETIKKTGSDVAESVKNISLEEIDSHLPEIAYKALSAVPHFSLETILTELSENEFPKQWSPDHPFGDSRFTLFYHENFIIELNIWQTEFTSVHEHAFSGAFRIIHGEALEVQYCFKVEESIAENIHLGSLKRDTVRLLNSGDQAKIVFGSDYIHNLIHLKNPTCTLIIRSSFELGESAKVSKQLEYVDSRLAFDSFPYPDGNEKLHSAIQSINMLNKLENNPNEQLYLNVLKSLRHEDIFYLLNKTFHSMDWLSVESVKSYLDSTLSDRTELIINALKNGDAKSRSFSVFREKKLSRETKAMLSALFCSKNTKELSEVFDALFGISHINQIATKTISALNLEAELFPKESEEGLIKVMSKLTDKELDEETQAVKVNLRRSIFRAFTYS